MSVVNKVARASRVTLADQVYRDLRELVLAGQVAPGEKFTLRGLAEAIGVSPMPVREAVGRLSAEGALEIMPNRAIRIPLVTRARFIELRTIRVELEGLAAETATWLATDAEVAEITYHQEIFTAESAKDEPDGAVAIRANKDFHFAIYRAARMPRLMQIVENLWLEVGPVLNLDLRANGRRLQEVEAHKHHQRLISALHRRDPADARAALRADIESASAFILGNCRLPDE